VGNPSYILIYIQDMTVMFRSLIRCRPGLALQLSVGVNTSLFSSSSSVELLVNPDNSKSKFKDTPVNPSTFKYIESIGVGIPKRKHTKRRGVRLRGRRATKTNFLTHQEEQDELLPIRRFPSKIPPPPFAAPYATTTKKNKNDSTPIIQRLPVKLIGSVASKEEGGGGEEAFPRGSKGLAEVVRNNNINNNNMSKGEEKKTITHIAFLKITPIVFG
jgi:hypothetical protein